MMPRRLVALGLLSATTTALSATATRRSPLTVAPPSNDQLVIAGKTFNSRLFLGTGKYKTAQDMADSIAASEAEVVTVAVRRVEGAVTSMLETSIDWDKVWLLPNTAGCTTAEDAVRVARLGREVAKTLGQDDNNFVKLEVITDSTYLLPDPVGTLAAARQLVKEGFAVLPYCSPDPVLCRHLEDIGCATVMPLGSPIGSGQGIDASSCIGVIVEQANVPVVVDAGLRCPSDAALAMELGADAVLANSAVARADDAPAMARAFKLATEAGRLAYTARPIAVSKTAIASSPLLDISK